MNAAERRSARGDLVVVVGIVMMVSGFLLAVFGTIPPRPAICSCPEIVPGGPPCTCGNSPDYTLNYVGVGLLVLGAGVVVWEVRRTRRGKATAAASETKTKLPANSPARCTTGT